MKYLSAILVGIVLFIGGMYLPSLAYSQTNGEVCKSDSSKATLKTEFPISIDMDKTLAVMFVNLLASKGQTPPPGLVEKIGSAVYIEKDGKAGVFFFDANDCYMTAVTGEANNIKKLIAETVGMPV